MVSVAATHTVCSGWAPPTCSPSGAHAPPNPARQEETIDGARGMVDDGLAPADRPLLTLRGASTSGPLPVRCSGDVHHGPSHGRRNLGSITVHGGAARLDAGVHRRPSRPWRPQSSSPTQGSRRAEIALGDPAVALTVGSSAGGHQGQHHRRPGEVAGQHSLLQRGGTHDPVGGDPSRS